ncbi:CHK1 protein kinase [Wolfiporia cocos MD-104 SS10]|uniref:CHK1 protein kinase n=1 Tax=Wolfiporia cocos (strain MD-104) TaxID=742152 RepID=A0A2H3JBE4_WOLCO|nr:CHK1 protein kinase [Wolfiporia cocos MD-104 SS10]
MSQSSSSKLRFPKVAGYQLVKRIGGGGFSTVYRAVNFDEHRVAACKMVTLTLETTKQARKTLDREIRVHSALKHENVLEFITAICVEPDEDLPYYPGLYMLLELAAGGDLFDKIAPDVGVGEEIAHYYFTQLVDGLTYIHEQGVCHRDLKPENLLLDAAGTLKICDFGLCSVYRLKGTNKTRRLCELCGSLPYVAPEMSQTVPYAAEPVDVWGCGIILFTMLAGNTPWDEPTKKSYEYSQYLHGLCFDADPWTRFDRGVLSLITGMLAVEPTERMTLAEVAAHPWMIQPSQLVHKGPATLAAHLTASLRESGDLDIADPNLESVDRDGDLVMGQNAHASQFTQSLQLFSQTQAGTRYTPVLTRFYAAIDPLILLPLIQDALTELKVKWKPAVAVDLNSGDDGETNNGDGDKFKEKLIRMRIGGYDRRRLLFKGWVELEHFTYNGTEGTFCVMQRDQGNPISWRQLWKSVIMSPGVEPYVLRKRAYKKE